MIKNDFTEVIHDVPFELYEDKLRGSGKFFGRLIANKTLNLKQICDSMAARGGFDGNRDILLSNAEALFEEIAFLLADSFTVNLKFFSITPRIRGLFASDRDEFDPELHKLGFTFRVLPPLRRILKHIKPVNAGLSDSGAFIKSFTDEELKETNGRFLPGNMFTLTGSKIEIAGDDPGNGVYLLPVDQSGSKAKVARIGANQPGRITGLIPDSLHQFNKVMVQTQYSNSGTVLRQPRVLVSNFVIEAL